MKITEILKRLWNAITSTVILMAIMWLPLPFLSARINSLYYLHIHPIPSFALFTIISLFMAEDRDERVTNLKTRETVYIYGGSSSNPRDPGTPITRNFYYDAKGRVIQIVENNHLGGTSYYSYKYDFVGNVLVSHEKHTASGTTNTVVTENTYDHRNRLTETSTTLNGDKTATVTYTYNALGQLVKKELGDVSTVKQTYNIQGWLATQTSDNFSMVLEYFTNQKYAGNITKWKWGHGPETNQHYNLMYDSFGRLYLGSHSGARNETINGYDLNGNIKSLSRSGTGTPTFSYGYIGNRLTALNNTYSYQYDKNGNMTSDSRNGLTFSYNSLNLAKEVKRGSTIVAKYRYAADGTKLQVQNSNGNTGYDYLGSLTLIKSFNTTTPEVAFAEGIITRNDITYFEKDHLGSVRVTVNQYGRVTGRNDYYPLGMRHLGGLINQDNRFLFNGKEDQVTGRLNLLDYGARMYNPEIGRWFNMDKLAEKYFSLSPFSYCANNPILFVDPDGNDIVIHYESNLGKSTFVYRGEALQHTNKFVNSVLTAYHYNTGNGGGDAMKAAATDPNVMIHIWEDEDTYANETGKSVVWNPSLGIETNFGDILSPATILEHEIDHAYSNQKDPVAHQNRRNDKSVGKQWTSAEEKRVIQGNESKTARANGEIGNRRFSRNGHRATREATQHGVIVNGGPTSTQMNQEKTDEYNKQQERKRLLWSNE